MPNNSARLISLKFSFSNSGIVPSSVRCLESETPEEQDERKKRASGILAIRPIQNVSLLKYLDDLEEAGYEMIDAFYQLRLDKDSRTFHMVHFIFCQHEHAEISDEFRTRRDTIRADLRGICTQAAWRARAFINPFYSKGEKVPGQAAISINLEVRTPLLRADGQPVMVWQKDGEGRRLGERPVPLKSDYHLRLTDNVIKLTTE